jgi:multimeric flavodoxin WrbA
MTTIVAINGSHRGEKGYTHFLLNKLRIGAEKQGAAYEEILLANRTIHHCLGCRTCSKQNHYLKCVYDQKDDVSAIFDTMRKADILIYATPIYIFAMTGLMKTFLDRITSTADSSLLTVSQSGLFFHHIDKKLSSKPFVVLTTQDNFEHETSKNVVSYFQTFSRFFDASQIGTIRCKSGGLVGHGNDKTKESEYPEIKAVYSSIEHAGVELARDGRISAKTQKGCNQNIITMPKVVEFLLGFDLIRKNRRIMAKVFERATANR